MKIKTYKKKLDENGNPLIVNGDFVVELVSDEGENEQLTIEQLNAMQYDELQLTDWYFVRKLELGIEVPNEIILERLSIRKKYDDLKNGIQI